MTSLVTSVRAWTLAFAALTMLACGDDDHGESTTKLDAAQLQDAAVARDATVDGSRLIPTDGSTMRDGSSVQDASTVHDGSTTRDGAPSDGAGDASSDTSLREACFRPFSILDDAGAARAQSGCACSLSEGAGYCVRRASQIADWDRYEAVVCLKGSWALVSDGPCFPSAPAEAAQCSSAGGTVVPAATVGDAGAPVVITVCPPGSHSLGGVKGGGVCCAPLEASRAECTAAGYSVMESDLDGGLSPNSCPGARRLRAQIRASASGPSAICCE